MLTITVAFYVLYNKITNWSEGPWLKLKHRLISRGNNLLSGRNIFFFFFFLKKKKNVSGERAIKFFE